MGSMGVTSMTSMIACDSSFMIKSLYKFRIPGIDYDFSINTTHVALLIVSIFILVVAIIARIKINKAEASDTPGFFQNIIELIVEMLQTMVEGIMGKNANKFVNYMSTLFLFIIISNISYGYHRRSTSWVKTLSLHWTSTAGRKRWLFWTASQRRSPLSRWAWSCFTPRVPPSSGRSAAGATASFWI